MKVISTEINNALIAAELKISETDLTKHFSEVHIEAERLMLMTRQFLNASLAGRAEEIETARQRFKDKMPEERPHPTSIENLKEFILWLYCSLLAGSIEFRQAEGMVLVSKAVLGVYRGLAIGNIDRMN